MTKVGRLIGRVFWRLNKDTSNISLNFQNAVVGFIAVDEMIDLRTEFSD